MQRFDLRRGGVLATLAALSALALLGAGPSWKKREASTDRLEETVGTIAQISATLDLRLEGVGLVVGLDGTGKDSTGPTWYRDKLVDEMRKAGVENPNKILADPRFAMVTVRARIPTGTDPTDRLDAEIELPAGSGTTSLAGGYLLQCRLKEIMIGGGTAHEGSDLAFAQGPVMIGSVARPDDVRIGRVLGGVRVKKGIPYRLNITANRQSFKTSKLVENVVNLRFHQVDGPNQKGMASSRTELGYQSLELKVPPVYHQNPLRYFRVVKLLPLVDTPALRIVRLETWRKDLLDPKKAGVAALKMEGLGLTSIDALKAGLESPNAQVRFFAAEALAYLNDASGAEVLAETAVKQPEFRAHALAALSATDQSAARMRLVKLMNEPEIEVRYGAFNALRTADENDPFLGRCRVMNELPDPEEHSDSMSLAIQKAALRRRANREEPFALYVVDSEGPPLVHVARTRRCEVVIFGRDCKLLTPIVLGNGPILINAADGDEVLEISKIVSTKGDESDSKVQASREIADVLRQTANLGARYPDIVALLQAASRQRNLPGPLVVDAVPAAHPTYTEAELLGKDTTAKKDDALTKTKLETKRKGFMGRIKASLWGDDDEVAAPKSESNQSNPKKDDAVQPASAEVPATEPQKPGFFGRLFNRFSQ